MRMKLTARIILITAAACVAALAQSGCPALSIAVVSGDDVLEKLRGSEDSENSSCQFENLDSGRPVSEVRDRLVTANAYIGAAPIVEALRLGADMGARCVTGTVTGNMPGCPNTTVNAAPAGMGINLSPGCSLGAGCLCLTQRSLASQMHCADPGMI